MRSFWVILCLFVLYLSVYAWQYQVTYYSGANTGYPCWSPDGTKIAYQYYQNSKYDIYTISSGGGGTPTRITSSAGWNRFPAWSPDGTRIAFVNGTNSPPWQMRIVALATGQETIIADGLYPRWSPDGNSIVFSRQGGVDTANIWKRQLSTGEETQLTFDTGYNINTSPDWSNDGQTIVYNHGDVVPTIWTISVNGGIPIQVPISYGYGPRWSPDDSLITLYAGNSMGGYSIYVFNMLNHNLFQSTPSSTHVLSEPDWSQGGGKIAYSNGDDGNIWAVTYGSAVEATSLGRIKSLYR